MVKTEYLIVRVTKMQERMLVSKMKSAGFNKKSDYVRSVLFMPNFGVENGN